MLANTSELTWPQMVLPSSVIIDRLIDSGARDEWTLDRIARNVSYLENNLDKVSGSDKSQIEASIAAAKSLLE